MLKALRHRIWWLAIILAGVSQPDAGSAGVAALVVAALLKAIAHAIWPPSPQLWRGRYRHQRASGRTSTRTDVRSATLWRPAAGPKITPAKPANSQEHHHACP
jgi:hypothetical protein